MNTTVVNEWADQLTQVIIRIILTNQILKGFSVFDNAGSTVCIVRCINSLNWIKLMLNW